MKVLILYDSVYGNTETIAQAIHQVFQTEGEVSLSKISEMTPGQFNGLSLLIVGAPTQRFRVTEIAINWLQSLPNGALKDIKVATFDTRLTMNEIKKTSVLAFFVRMFGEHSYGARYIADQLRKKGAELITPPEGFYVAGMSGPLVAGEVDRAAQWAQQIISK